MSLSLSPPVCSPMNISPEEFEFEARKPSLDDLRGEINYESKCMVVLSRLCAYVIV